ESEREPARCDCRGAGWARPRPGAAMRSFKARLAVAVGMGALVCGGTAIANIMAFRHTGLSCVPAPGLLGQGFKLVGSVPPFMPGMGVDPGVTAGQGSD